MLKAVQSRRRSSVSYEGERVCLGDLVTELVKIVPGVSKSVGRLAVGERP